MKNSPAELPITVSLLWSHIAFSFIISAIPEYKYPYSTPFPFSFPSFHFFRIAACRIFAVRRVRFSFLHSPQRSYDFRYTPVFGAHSSRYGAKVQKAAKGKLLRRTSSFYMLLYVAAGRRDGKYMLSGTRTNDGQPC